MNGRKRVYLVVPQAELLHRGVPLLALQRAVKDRASEPLRLRGEDGAQIGQRNNGESGNQSVSQAPTSARHFESNSLSRRRSSNVVRLLLKRRLVLWVQGGGEREPAGGRGERPTCRGLPKPAISRRSTEYSGRMRYCTAVVSHHFQNPCSRVFCSFGKY